MKLTKTIYEGFLFATERQNAHGGTLFKVQGRRTKWLMQKKQICKVQCTACFRCGMNRGGGHTTAGSLAVSTKNCIWARKCTARNIRSSVDYAPSGSTLTPRFIPRGPNARTRSSRLIPRLAASSLRKANCFLRNMVLLSAIPALAFGTLQKSARRKICQKVGGTVTVDSGYQNHHQNFKVEQLK